MHRPTRKVRRRLKRQGKGKGYSKGKGKRRHYFIDNLNDDQMEDAFSDAVKVKARADAAPLVKGRLKDDVRTQWGGTAKL